ncbi:MAG: hypothetical protein F4Y74_14470 [Gemmatimonadales bacterium]|nr:hypothetical protein [Gemmatimonadales bacterium]MYG20722.1 hypothetical protein [Gemmatimonadales bacterium]
MTDGNLGIWARGVAGDRRAPCRNHRLANALDRLPKTEQPVDRETLRPAAYAPSRTAAERGRDAFAAALGGRAPQAAEVLGGGWERMTASTTSPRGTWRHPRTTHVVGSPFASVGLRTNAANGPSGWRTRRPRSDGC